MKKWLKILVLIILILVVGSIIYFGNLKKNGEGGELVGGCAGVPPDYLQECCDNWAEENNIVHIQCVGEWVVEDNQCAWGCT